MNEKLLDAEDIRQLKEDELREEARDLEDFEDRLLDDDDDYDTPISLQTLGLIWADFM
ncbi:MAG: hypothetical protein PVF17_00590 [Ignavibacteria bacterium]|jgi:hypothetical protein